MQNTAIAPKVEYFKMADHRSFELDKTQRHLGPIWLTPGILPINVITLFYSSAIAIGFVNLINLIQPLILQEQLGMTGGEGVAFVLLIFGMAIAISWIGGDGHAVILLSIMGAALALQWILEKIFGRSFWQVLLIRIMIIAIFYLALRTWSIYAF